MAHKKNTFKVQEFKAYINDQLKRTDTYANDNFKAGLCIALEHILKQCNCYEGYNDNYWLEKGAEEWLRAGEPDFPEKNQFIYGPTGQQYNRIYY